MSHEHIHIKQVQIIMNKNYALNKISAFSKNAEIGIANLFDPSHFQAVF